MADHEIDSLNIKIKSNATTAQKAIRDLSTELGNLSKALGKLNNISNLNALANGVGKLAKSMKELKSVTNKDYTKLAKGLQDIGSVKSTKLTNTALALEELSKSAKPLISLSEKASGLSQLAQGIGKLGGKSVKNAVNNIPKLSNSLQTLSGGQITKVAKSMSQLGVAVQSLKGGGLDGRVFNKLTENLKKLEKIDLSSIDKSASKIKVVADALAKLSTSVTNMNETATAVKDMAVALRELGGAKSASASLANFVDSMNNFGNASQVAAQNLPQLASTLKEVMQTLSDAPEVSQSTIDMTNSLAKLANSMKTYHTSTNSASNDTSKMITRIKALGEISSKASGIILKGFGYGLKYTFKGLSATVHGVGTAIGKVTSKIKQLASDEQKATKSTSAFAQAVGTLYVKFWLLFRVFSKLGSMIKSSMDYIETLNYFDAAWGQVADKAVDNWAEAGYDSAEAYADSFMDRAKSLTEKMSGFTIDQGGNLASTGLKSLGMDASQVMQYQALFGQMASSMGVTSENALRLSNVLTEIGADLASVKNMNFSDVWDDMASGLTGMSRTLDKYGVNIRNAAMNEKLANLGIQTTVDKLSQADKALLRTIILLDSTKYAWGDLADTLDNNWCVA